MELCRGTAEQNAALMASNTQVPQECKLATATQVAPAYVGRGLLGRYTFTVPASDLAGTSALRVSFKFAARKSN